MGLATIRIEAGEGHSIRTTRVFLNDEDISHFVRGLTFELGVGKVPTATLEIIAKVDIPENFQALVKASINDRGYGDPPRGGDRRSDGFMG